MNQLEKIVNQAKQSQRQDTTQKKPRLFNRNGYEFDFYWDLETTGGNPIQNDVLQICCLVTERGKYQEIDRFVSYVKPELINHITWSDEAEKVHGISKDQAATFPSRRKVLFDLMNFLKPYLRPSPQNFICHASRSKFFTASGEIVYGMFDYNFMEWAFRKENLVYSWYKMFIPAYCLSTLWLSRKLKYGQNQAYDEEGIALYTKKGKIKKEGNALNVWAKRIGFDLKHHDAVSDTECCLKTMEFLMKKHEEKIYKIINEQ